jgi:exodeoxyribonuclease VII small subunit
VKKSGTADFEQSMRELEALVERLEQGDLPLEEALKQFERGIALTKACQAALKTAEHKVEILLKSSGAGDEPALEEFEPEA